MPPRGRPPSYHPPTDHATFRDLLLFEERLKTNAARLKKQKTRYQFFLFVLCACICLLLSDLLMHTYFMPYPVNYFLEAEHPLWAPIWIPHTYVVPGLLLILVTTLVLFFASGMYAEKIGYANRYVPSANRALRSFNMYFNIRSPSIIPLPYPISLILQNQPPSPPSQPATPSARTIPLLNPNARSPLHPLPPASNPRGELIFSSRIPPAFRQAYEDYRARFEKRRAEKLASRRWWWAFGWLVGISRGTLGPAREGDSGQAEGESEAGLKGSRGRTTSITSTGSLTPTPLASRRPSRSPSPNSVGVRRDEKDGERRRTEDVRKRREEERRKKKMIGQLEVLEERLGKDWASARARGSAGETGQSDLEGDEKADTGGSLRVSK